MFKFTVSEARTAIACPRVFYFDEQRFRRNRPRSKVLTQIWVDSASPVAGCGKLFHDTIETFNRQAGRSADFAQAFADAARASAWQDRVDAIAQACMRFINLQCLNRAALQTKTPPQAQAFVAAVNQYVKELSQVFAQAIHEGRKSAELIDEFFRDDRKRLDVSFNVAANDVPVRVRGILDYIYFDYRQNSKRIIDYKLLPPDAISKDLMQVSLYSLMHQKAHGTQADAAVFYLSHRREMHSLPWQQIHAERFKVYDLLASMAAWSNYDEATQTGLKPPGEPALCKHCTWNRGDRCQQRLGPYRDGVRDTRWSELAKTQPIEPDVHANKPPESPPPETIEEASDISSEAPAAAAQNTAPTDGLLLGQTLAGGIPVVMPLAALTTHVSILGAAGSGKSWLAKVVAEEAILQGVPVLAIDPQGDLAQFLKPFDLSKSQQATAVDLQRQAELRQKMEVRIWTPGTSHGRRLCLSPLRLARQSDLQGIESPQRRQEEWQAMLGIAAGNIVQLAQSGGDAEVKKTFVLAILQKLTDRIDPRPLGLEDIIAAMSDPESLGLETEATMITKADRTKLTQKLYARLKGPTANLFSGGAPLDMEQFVTPRQAGKTPLNVVYLNAMADDSQKQYFVAALAAEVYRWMITSASSGRVRLLVFLDEAKDFLPAGAGKPPAKDPLLRLFAQGRKFGVSCLICTQSPRSVDYQVFSNASTKLIGRLEAAQDVQRVAEWFKDGSGPPAWLAGRNGAPNGSLVGRWPGVASELDGQEFRSRPLYSLHEGAWSPERVEAEWSADPLSQAWGDS